MQSFPVLFGQTRLDPRSIADLAAWYDVSDYSSLVVDGSNRVSLIADKSGNSATNCLCLNGASGNYASAPDSAALDITSDLELRFDCRINTLARVECFGAKRGAAAAAGSSYWLQKSITGLLQFYYSDGASFFQFDSTATLGSVGLSNLQRVQLRVTVDKDNGASGTTVQFFYRTDGIITGTSGWTQLGSNVTVAGTNAINNSSSVFEVGSQQGGTVDAFLGNIFRAQVYNGIAGTLVFDANFATASKLATSFTESSSNAATVTINSSGDLGARICGERDLVQLTASKQPIYLPWSGTNYGFTNGASGTYFSTPDAAAIDLTGSLELRYYGALDDWTPSAINTLVAKAGAFLLGINTSGQPRFVWVDSGSGVRSLTCNAAVPFTDRGLGGVKVEFVPATGTATFYTSTDFSTWTQLGAAQVFGATSIINSTGLGEIHATNAGTTERASGTVQRVQFVNGIGGTVVADFNPALYTSGTTFTASTGEVWTLNGGATIVNRTSVYFDGSDDYMASAQASLPQPLSSYLTGQQVSWTNNDVIWGFGAPGIFQNGSTPEFKIYGGTGSGNANTSWAIGTSAVASAVINSGTNSLRVNRGTAATGGTGSNAGTLVTLGANSSGSANANIRANEVCIYAAAHDTSVQDRVIQYAGRKWGISGV